MATPQTITIHVQPNAKTTEVTGWHGDAIKIRIAAPAIDGRANDLLIAFLSDILNLPKRAITIRHGHLGRQKTIEILSSHPDIASQLLSQTSKNKKDK